MFSFSTISNYQQQLENKEISCEAVVHHYLSEIEKHKRLNAFIEVFADEALAKAKLLDEARANGEKLKKLHGVVIAIKDVICYKDHKVRAASKILDGFTSLYTATALQYLLDEDAIIIGNCNCDEFAMGSTNENSGYGPVKNFANEEKVSGGSSGGSAVAVQAGLCMLSLGSDTGGSVRQPADHCGIIGLKPGYGRISRYGLLAYASSFDQIGIFGTTVKDIRLLLDIMSQPDKMDSTMMQNILPQTAGERKTYKYCYFTEVMEHPSLDPEIRAGIETKIESLRSAGNEVESVSFNLLDYIVPAYYVLTTAEASSNLSRYDGVRYGHRSQATATDIDKFYKQNRSEGFGLEVKRRIMLGTFVLSTGYYDAYFAKAQQIRRLLVEKTNEVFSTYDGIIMPVTPKTAPLLGNVDEDPIAVYLADIFTVFANLTGLPAIAIPMFSHSDNMPFGLQIMTKNQNELPLLHMAEMVMDL